MSDLNRERELFEVIAASDAINNARAILDAPWESVCNQIITNNLTEEHYEAIRHYVYPLLAAEHERLTGEYHRLTSLGEA